jgi:isoleucyl-tRNA synthetase
VRSALLPLWNAWYFLSLYANADRRRAEVGRTPTTNVLDRYALASLRTVVEQVTAAMDDYDLSGACAALEGFLDRLNNWYIRRSRDRFWGTAGTGGGSGDGSDTADAFDTLATVLEVLCRLAAPLAPMVTEAVWTGLTGGESVHLASWPDPSGLPDDPDLVARMDLVREVCSAAHSVRKATRRRARLPLRELVVAGPAAGGLAEFTDLIAEEVNVKSVVLADDPSRYATSQLSVVFKVAAPRLGPDTQAAHRAARTGDWALLSGDDEGRARAGGIILEPGEFEMQVVPVDPATTRPLPGRAGVVVLDTRLTEALEIEGRARDLVRAVQQVRRDRGLEVSDRIRLEVAGGPALGAAIEAHRAWIAEQVLAVSVSYRPADDPPGGSGTTADDPAGGASVELADGTSATLWVHRA